MIDCFLNENIDLELYKSIQKSGEGSIDCVSFENIIQYFPHCIKLHIVVLHNLESNIQSKKLHFFSQMLTMMMIKNN